MKVWLGYKSFGVQERYSGCSGMRVLVMTSFSGHQHMQKVPLEFLPLEHPQKAKSVVIGDAVCWRVMERV